MFNKILIANRGDRARQGAAAKPNSLACAAGAGELDKETAHVQ
jgi:hypothetical protein